MSDAKQTSRIKNLSRKYSLISRPIQAFGALVVLVAFMATYSSKVIADSDFDSTAPHPSCLDFESSISLLNDFLTEPLDLNCYPNGASKNVFDYFGYTTYERSRDSAGERRGSLGYQRFVADDGAALYVLRIESGGNAVSTEIMTGKEVKKSNQQLLEQGQLHSTGKDCQGVSDVWIEPDDAINLMIELSAYEALQALLLPKSGPPSTSRKTQLLNALLKQQQHQDDYLDFRLACAITAEYRLDSASLQLQLTMLRFDIDDERSKDAFNWFRTLLPASDNLDVAMILEEDLPNISDKLMAPFKDQYQFPLPKQPDETLSIFFELLKSAVERRDIEALIEMTTEDVMLGFGGSGGHQDLRSWLTQNSADDDWKSLNEMLEMPGIQLSSEVFCVPYPSCVGSESADFSFDTYITIQPNTPMHALPMDNAQVLRKLNFERVEWQYPYDGKARFRLVQTFAGERGYINKTLLRSPFDLRMEIVSTPQGWLIQSILSGD